MKRQKKPITTMQLYGERCSGTNYAEQLFIKNFKDLKSIQKFGTKHRFHKYTNEEDTSNCIFIVVYRDTFDWLRSYHRQPYHVAPELLNIPFSEFIRKQWREVYTKSSGISEDDPRWGEEIKSERDPDTGERFKNVLKLRIAKIENWESLDGKVENFHHVCYEKLRDNPKDVLQTISNKFNLVQKEDFQDVKSYRGRNERNYVAKPYQPVCPEDLEFITSESNLKIEKSIGYDLKERKAKMHIEWLEFQLKKTATELDNIQNSVSFKVGRITTLPARKIRLIARKLVSAK